MASAGVANVGVASISVDIADIGIEYVAIKSFTGTVCSTKVKGESKLYEVR